MTASVTPLVPAPPANLDDWKVALESQYLKTVKGILDFGLMVYQFKQWCEKAGKKKGGSVFSSSVEEWRAMSQTTASKWCRIGEEYDRLIRVTNNLPAAFDTIYEITSLPDEILATEINPRMSCVFVRGVKATHRAEKAAVWRFAKTWEAEQRKAQFSTGFPDASLGPKAERL